MSSESTSPDDHDHVDATVSPPRPSTPCDVSTQEIGGRTNASDSATTPLVQEAPRNVMTASTIRALDDDDPPIPLLHIVDHEKESEGPQLHDGPPGPPRLPQEHDVSLSKKVNEERAASTAIEVRMRHEVASEARAAHVPIVLPASTNTGLPSAAAGRAAIINSGTATARGTRAIVLQLPRATIVTTGDGNEPVIAEPVIVAPVVLPFYRRKGFVYVMVAMALLAIGIAAAVQLSSNLDGSTSESETSTSTVTNKPTTSNISTKNLIPPTATLTPTENPTLRPTNDPTKVSCNVDADCPTSRYLCMSPACNVGTNGCEYKPAMRKGCATLDTWTGIRGNGLSTLKNLASFPDSPDISASMSGLLEVFPNAEYFGSRIQAFVTPEYTCDYTFYMASDDDGELNLSHDATPDNKKTIASVPGWVDVYDWGEYRQQTSQPQPLVVGEKYYLEALYKGGQGSNHAEIAWSCTSQGMEIEVINISKIPTFSRCAADSDCPSSGNLCMTPACNVATNRCEYNPTMHTGCATLDTWTGISGNELSTLKNLASFPDNPDTSTSVSSLLEVSSNADNFGSRIQAFVTPEYTCDYTFYMSSDEQGELNLSHDATPNNKKTIASVPGRSGIRQWDRFEDQTSVPNPLIAREKYYLEALFKGGQGPNHAEIAWSCTSQGMEIEVIDISRIPTFCNADSDCPASDNLCMTPACNVATNGCKYSPTLGCATLDMWTGISGDELSMLKNLASFPNSPDTSTKIYSLLEVSPNAENFGSRIRTWITPEYTCDYTFYISSSEQGELNLSHNAISSNKKTIASVPGWTRKYQWDHYGQQTSQPQFLVAGEKYYLEALYKGGSVRPHAEIAWSCASQGMEMEVIDISKIPTFCNADSDCPATGNICMTPACNVGTNRCEYNPTMRMGCATVDTWMGISGDELSALKNLASFPDSPDISTSMSGLLEVSFSAENFGSRIQTLITPEYTCDYTFYMASDDYGELNLSHDATPDNKKTIASVPGWTRVYGWNKYEEQTSEPQPLVAGEKYYLEALYKEGEAGNHAEIAWSCASQGIAIEVIDISKMYVA